MKNLKEIILEKLVINKDSKPKYKYHYYPKTKDELQELVNKLIEERGNDANLNDIDTSEITDMSYLFEKSIFNGDISGWDVSKVKNMVFMFFKSKFDGNISKWDVSNVKDMSCMFANSEFTGKNGDISNWDVSKVENMKFIFDQSPLQKNPPKWYKE